LSDLSLFEEVGFVHKMGLLIQILGVPTGEKTRESRKYAKKEVVWSGT
jgi:hypothetical protein